MRHKFFSKIIYFLLSVVIIAATGVFIFRSRIFASDIGGGDQQTLDLGSNLGSKTVRITINGNEGKLEISKNLFSSCRIGITGFQNEAKIRGTIKLGTSLKAIEITGPAGAHAENRQFFITDEQYCPKPLTFAKNGNINYNIYSDEPGFLQQDFNSDGATDLAVEYRNYDLNPILDGTRDIYLFDKANKRFEFSRTESFRYREID